MTTPSCFVFLHRNDGTPVVAGAGARLRVLLRPGLHTLEHVLDDASAKLGLHSAATGLCWPDGTRIGGLDDLTPKCDVVVLEGRKGFVAPGSSAATPRTKARWSAPSPVRGAASSGGQDLRKRGASATRGGGRTGGVTRPRTPPRAGRQAPQQPALESRTPAAARHAASATKELVDTGGGSQRHDVTERTHGSVLGELEETAVSTAGRESESDRLPTAPHLEATERPPSQESPVRRRVTVVRRSSSARQQRSQANAKPGGMADQLLENRSKHEASKQAKLKQELAATRQGMVESAGRAHTSATSGSNGTSAGDESPVLAEASHTNSPGSTMSDAAEARALVLDRASPGTHSDSGARLLLRESESLAETWTPPPLQKVTSVDTTTTAASVPTYDPASDPASTSPSANSTTGEATAPDLADRVSLSPRHNQLGAAVACDTYADLYVRVIPNSVAWLPPHLRCIIFVCRRRYMQVREIYNMAELCLQRQLEATSSAAAGARDPLLLRMTDLVQSFDSLANDIGAMPAGATVGQHALRTQQAGVQPMGAQRQGKSVSELSVTQARSAQAANTEDEQLRTPPPLPKAVKSASKPGRILGRGGQVRVPNSVHRSDENEDENIEASPAGKGEAAAINIQAHVRGHQDRQRMDPLRAATTGLLPSRLDEPVDRWLDARNESGLTKPMKDEFGIETLWDLVAVIQSVDDWKFFIPNDPMRRDTLWKAVQHEVEAAQHETAQATAEMDDKKRAMVARAAAQAVARHEEPSPVLLALGDGSDALGDGAALHVRSPLGPPPVPQLETSNGGGTAISRKKSTPTSAAGSVAQTVTPPGSPGRDVAVAGPFTPTSFRA